MSLIPAMEVIPLGFYKKWCIIPLGFYKLITFIPLGVTTQMYSPGRATYHRIGRQPYQL